MEARKERFFPLLDRVGADALLVTNLRNIRYLSEFTGSSAVMLLNRDKSYLLTDGRYETQAKQEVAGAEVLIYKKRNDLVNKLLGEWGVKTLAFEGRDLSYTEWSELGNRLSDIKLLPLKDETRRLRSVKEEGEIEALRRGVELAKEVFFAVRDRIVPGGRERDIALAFDMEAKKRGAERVAFDIIVASGERSALPHAVPTDKVIEEGDLVIVDFGVVLGGYHTDETCTLFAGNVPEQSKEIYNIVMEAHDRVIAGIRPGMKARDVDGLARDFICSKGFGDSFGHGTGHGVGLEVHELPVISEMSDDIIEEGMVFTVEPGIYIPGFGGVRIEDMVLVTSDGAEVITKCNNALRG